MCEGDKTGEVDFNLQVKFIQINFLGVAEVIAALNSCI